MTAIYQHKITWFIATTMKEYTNDNKHYTKTIVVPDLRKKGD